MGRAAPGGGMPTPAPSLATQSAVDFVLARRGRRSCSPWRAPQPAGACRSRDVVLLMGSARAVGACTCLAEGKSCLRRRRLPQLGVQALHFAFAPTPSQTSLSPN
eukprot:6193333-Pleurochrysis_carterae.AAC.1